ncbi:hypothetical protein J6590_105520 [Homalodisca vitripennis]|nr:hypothetical protein J6590_105520 [Homalodisca vitripennis]
MKRSRKRTTERSKRDEQTLKRAFELVESGRSVKRNYATRSLKSNQQLNQRWEEKPILHPNRKLF